MWHDADDRLAKAVERFEEGALEAARLMLRTLERRGVVSPRIDLYLGHCHLEQGALRAAIRRYRRCIALGTPSPAPWLGLGLCYGRLGILERAIRSFREALRKAPELEEVHCNLTHCYALAGDLKRAQEHARRAAALDPRCPHVHRHMALAWLLAGDAERSLRAWRRVLVLAPDHPEHAVGVGRAYARLGRRDEARAWYAKALDGPFAADAHFGLGDLSRSVEEHGAAGRHYRRAVERDAGFAEARLRWAESLARTGHHEEAWPVLAPLMAHEAPSADALAVAATVLSGCGQRTRALRLLRDLVRSDPGRGSAWKRLGRHLLEEGRPRVAARCLRRACRRDPEDTTIPRLLARALGRAGLRRRAVAVLARAAWRHPGDEDLHLDVAAALVARGRPGAAERALLRALSWNPEAPGLWAAAAELALDDGRLDLARSRLSSALRRDRRHPRSLALLLRALRQAGAARRATNAGRAALRVLPPGDEAVREHAAALLDDGRADEALVVLRRYVLVAPEDAAGYALYADALEVCGDTQAARTQRRLQRIVSDTMASVRTIRAVTT